MISRTGVRRSLAAAVPAAALLLTSFVALPAAHAASIGTLTVTPATGIGQTAPSFVTSGACPAANTVRIKIFGGDGTAAATVADPLTINSPKNMNGPQPAAALENGLGGMTINASQTWASWASNPQSPVLTVLNGTYTVRAWCSSGDWFDGQITFTGTDVNGATYATAVAPTPPGAPTAASATAGVNSATVSWAAPASTGGSAITGYTATASPGGLSCSTAGLSCTVTGLTAGQPYTFTVVAANSVGTGPASAASSAVTPSSPPPPPVTTTAPGAPTGVVAAAGDAQATVSWAAPASDGGSAVTGYTVTSAPGGKSCTTAGLSCVVSGLTDGTAYTFSVTATNLVGTSAVSTASAAVTPKGTLKRNLKKMILVAGVAKVGKIVKATIPAGTFYSSSGTPNAGITYTYKWKRGAAFIKGAVKSTYKLIKADKGKKISVLVTAKKVGYSAAAGLSRFVTVK